ncbi:DNA phosphorothioation-dependent restriction protein DptG [Citrobacter freundii]|nr:DNA phosphorothioation-dependent restriction protein DptG [Citrobacter freundii]ELK6450111.1 DNA phosphorothioation-dependent restriction protein DptG [Citrobacter freundii]
MRDFTSLDTSISLVRRCIENENDSNYANIADTYLPIGPNNRDNNIEWTHVYQKLFEKLYGLSLNRHCKESLRVEVLDSIRSVRDTRELVDVIDELYFNSNELDNITPLAYLVSNQEKLSARTKTMINIISGLINGQVGGDFIIKGNNPLENILISNIHRLCTEHSLKDNTICYLPFLQKVFTQDLNTLAANPEYLLSEVERFIHLYVFIYLSQLTIQVCIPNNVYQPPSAKPLYFILETETASKERHECNQYGYDYIFSNKKGIANYLFPALGYFNRIDKKPAWQYDLDESEEHLGKINEFNKLLALLFGEDYQNECSLQRALNKGVSFHKQIFEETLSRSKKNSRKGRNSTVVNTFEDVFSSGFITNRKAAGKYFVLNSNIIMLLTNLIIKGKETDKILIDDLIEGFKNRGVWLDLKSKRALLKFYESVGNIEKLSDSGDAVYVKSTI